MENKIQEYARLAVKTGVNLQRGQILVVNSPIECAAFTRALANAAYDAGAKEVVISWNDEQLGRLRFERAAEEVFDAFPHWRREFYTTYAKEGAAFLSIASSDPELLQGVEPSRIARQQKSSGEALREYRQRMMNNENTWCVISVPTAAWAKRVFKDIPAEAAVQKLWQAIFQAVRVDGEQDAAAVWREHLSTLHQNRDRLNQYRFQYLKYSSRNGTSLTVELPKDHLWVSGMEYTPDGVAFVANLPTEEVYTLPKRDGVNGVVVSSKPLNFQGNLIEHMRLTFKDGKVVSFSADKGEAILKSLLDVDEGASYLGEVALVPYHSPISDSKLLFYNTLFDENAACHLALGKAYPTCLAGGGKLTAAELAEKGVNDSIVHEDFMIGTGDLSILGVTADGRKIPVFENGDFVGKDGRLR